MEGQAIPEIVWNIADQTLASYEVKVDGVSQGVVSWDQMAITIDLERLDLEVGTHSIELIVRDGFGNAATDVVVVTIMERSTQPLGGDQGILLVVGVLIVIIVVMLWRRG